MAEKAIKAFLYAKEEEIVVGHSVERLCASDAQYQPEFVEKVRRWRILVGFYIPTRYPNGLPDGIPANIYTQEVAQSSVRMVEEVVMWIKEIL